MKTYDYINRVDKRFRLAIFKGMKIHSPLVAICIACKKNSVPKSKKFDNQFVGERSILKNFLRSRKIYLLVMHSNERGGCCLRTLVDRKRKRYDNAVDVVIRDLHTFSSVTSHEL